MFFRNHSFLMILLGIFKVVILFIMPSNVYAEEEYVEYKVLQNDTLTKVLKKHSIKPIYGKAGTLEEVLKLNPKKQDTHGNLILIGEILLLPKKIDLTHMIDNKKLSGVNMKKEKRKIDLSLKDGIKNEQTLNKSELKRQDPFLKAPKNTKETDSHIKITKKEASQKPEPQITIDPNKNFKQKNVFIPNKPANTEKETIFNPKDQENKSKTQTEYLTFTKIQLPALPLKSNNTQKTTAIQKQEINSDIEIDSDFILDTSHFCSPTSSHKIRLWESKNMSCKPVKKYFLFFERNSL